MQINAITSLCTNGNTFSRRATLAEVGPSSASAIGAINSNRSKQKRRIVMTRSTMAKIHCGASDAPMPETNNRHANFRRSPRPLQTP